MSLKYVQNSNHRIREDEPRKSFIKSLRSKKRKSIRRVLGERLKRF